MKKIRILAVLLIIVFLFTSLRSGIKGFTEGWNEAGDSREFTYPTVSVPVKADKALVADSVFNSAIKQNVPYRIETLETEIDESAWCTILYMLIVPIGLVCLYGIYNLARLVVAVTRKEVFIRKNVKRMRIFVYTLIFTAVLLELNRYCQYCDIVFQIHLTGYEIEAYSPKYPWVSFLIFALFTEIFAVGVKMKEEQDLTI